jgi:hypothetical protein
MLSAVGNLFLCCRCQPVNQHTQQRSSMTVHDAWHYRNLTVQPAWQHRGLSAHPVNVWQDGLARN